jgi:hypothetical protein
MRQIPIPGLDGYFVTDTGLVIGRWGRPVAPYTDRDGYLRVTLAMGRGAGAKRLHRGIHQLVCSAFHGQQVGMEVRHLDGNQLNNAPHNLAWGTRQENSDDRIIHGTVPKGETHGCAKLTTHEVKSIRFFLACEIPQRLIAGWFDVSQATVNNISTNRNWR